MGRYSQAAYTEPQKYLAKMLDETCVISDEFKHNIWRAAQMMQEEAYERATKEANRER